MIFLTGKQTGAPKLKKGNIALTWNGVREYISENRLIVFILATSIFLGTFVRIWNLHDARFLNSDEYRSLTGLNVNNLGMSPFLNLVYKVPLLVWGKYHRVALYTTAFWGIFNILLVFFIGKILFNDKVGSYSALILSLFAIHVAYSRSGYAIMLQLSLILIAFLLFSLYFKDIKQRYIYIVLTGIFLGVSFLTYIPSYAAIASFFLLLYIILRSRNTPSKKIFIVTIILSCSSLIILILFEILGRINTGSYFGSLYKFKGITGMYFGYTPLIFFKEILRTGGVFQFLIIITGFIYCAIVCFLKTNEYLLILVRFVFFSYLIFSIMGMLKFHTIYPRQYAYLVPFLCIICAHLVYKAEVVTNKYFALVFLVIFSILSFPESLRIARNTFKIKPITQWLELQNIPKYRVVTALDIHEKGDDLWRGWNVPGEFPDYPRGYYKIDWEQIKELYLTKKVLYILISGIGSQSSIGYKDPILKKIKPLETWLHPYPHLNHTGTFGAHFLKKVQDFAIYDLKDIFGD